MYWTKVLNSIRAWRTLRARGAQLQQLVDTVRIFKLLKRLPEHTHIQKILETHPDLETLQQAVQTAVAQDLDQLIQNWKREKPKPLPPYVPPPENSPHEFKDSVNLLRNSLAEEYDADMKRAQYRAFGFSVSVAPSTLGIGAMNGTFINGRAKMGSIVAIYPGVALSPADIIRLPNGTASLAKKNHIIARYDGTIIDAGPEALRLLPPHARDLPLAVAHLVNHPPRGTQPNVLLCPIEYADLDGELSMSLSSSEFIPSMRGSILDLKLLAPPETAQETSWFDKLDEWVRSSLADMAPAEEEKRVCDDGSTEALPPRQGLLLVTNRDVRDEELFLNYRLNPTARLPGWYHPVDVDEDHRRWDGSNTVAR